MAPPLNPTQARTIDPVLTQVARGYTNAAHAWIYLFPVVPVAQRGGRIIEFGAEQFASINSERAPGATRQQVHFGHSSREYSLGQHALDGKVPREILEEAMAVPGINYSSVAVRKTMDIVSLQIEIAAARLATRASTYAAANKQALAGAAQWSHDDSEPAKAVEAAKEVIATGIGREPNTMVVGPAVHRGLVNNPDVIDRIKHTEGLTGSANPSSTRPSWRSTSTSRSTQWRAPVPASRATSSPSGARSRCSPSATFPAWPRWAARRSATRTAWRATPSPSPAGSTRPATPGSTP